MRKDTLHLKAPGNWINDPNGFIYYRGRYHLFYQHFPYASVWGTMHWGHAVSEDLVHWEHKEIALFPTKEYDRNGVFSGSAIEKDGKLYLYYSAVRYLQENPNNIHLAKDGNMKTCQAMLISEDGEVFDNWKCKKKIIPVISDRMIADEGNTRDPKVWMEDGRYYMILGSTYQNQIGKVVLFSSADAENWSYVSGCTNETYGEMIECPDLFLLDNQRVFLGSPMGIRRDGKEYENHSVCAFAEFDTNKGLLKLEDEYKYIDYGGDLYAPQTNLDSDGRRVMIAWMRMPWAVDSADRGKWNGMMCLPRVVEIREKHICFSVHPNVAACFKKTVSAEEAEKSDVPMRIICSLSEGKQIMIGGYRIWLENQCVCTNRSQVFLDTTHYQSISRTPQIADHVSLEIFVEQNLIEIFVNDGFYVVSNVVYGLERQIQGKTDSIQLLEE